MADIVFWPCVADFKYQDVAGYPDGYIDVCLFNGGIRSTEHEQVARLLRQKSKTLVAYGACAMDGGIPALANLKSPREIFDAVYHNNPSLDNPGKRRAAADLRDALRGAGAAAVLPAGAAAGRRRGGGLPDPRVPARRHAGLEGAPGGRGGRGAGPQRGREGGLRQQDRSATSATARNARSRSRSSSARTWRSPSRTGACSSRGSSAWARRRAAAAARSARRPTCRAGAATARPAPRRRTRARRCSAPSARCWTPPPRSGRAKWSIRSSIPTGTFYRFSLASSRLKARAGATRSER